MSVESAANRQIADFERSHGLPPGSVAQAFRRWADTGQRSRRDLSPDYEQDDSNLRSGDYHVRTLLEWAAGSLGPRAHENCEENSNRSTIASWPGQSTTRSLRTTSHGGDGGSRSDTLDTVDSHAGGSNLDTRVSTWIIERMCESIRPYLRHGRWTEPAPRFCPNGHRLGAGRSLVSVMPCVRIGGHHRTHTCLACNTTIYCPPIHTDCEH